MANIKRPALFILLALFSLALVACGSQGAEPITGVDLTSQTQTVSVDGGAYTDVSAAGLAFMLENKDFPLINVHIPYEGEIEGTDDFVPFNEIEANPDKFPVDKDARIVVYCRSGSMSAQAASTLVKLGYTDVWNLDGGMIAWQNSGRPLLNQ
jgi:rhodanese-related sulfurtransferase